MRRLIIAVVLVGLSSTACNASDPKSAQPATTTTGSPAVTPAPSTTAGAPVDPRDDGFNVAFGEYVITLEAPAIRPGKVTFVIRNAGALTHGFEAKADGDSSGKGSGDRFKIETRTFNSGETLRLDADLPAGTYEVECFVANHSDLGMKTTLDVRADAPLI